MLNRTLLLIATAFLFLSGDAHAEECLSRFGINDFQVGQFKTWYDVGADELSTDWLVSVDYSGGELVWQTVGGAQDGRISQSVRDASGDYFTGWHDEWWDPNVGDVIVDLTYTPGIWTPLEICSGDHYTSSGNFFFDAHDNGWETGSWSFFTDVASWEEVSVPAGTFLALRIDSTLRTDSTYGTFDIVETSSSWNVPGIGSVLISYRNEGGSNTLELVDTNFQYVPEPHQGILSLVALSAIVVLRRTVPTS